jgi:hypothetical protein
MVRTTDSRFAAWNTAGQGMANGAGSEKMVFERRRRMNGRKWLVGFVVMCCVAAAAVCYAGHDSEMVGLRAYRVQAYNSQNPSTDYVRFACTAYFSGNVNNHTIKLVLARATSLNPPSYATYYTSGDSSTDEEGSLTIIGCDFDEAVDDGDTILVFLQENDGGVNWMLDSDPEEITVSYPTAYDAVASSVECINRDSSDPGGLIYNHRDYISACVFWEMPYTPSGTAYRELFTLKRTSANVWQPIWPLILRNNFAKADANEPAFGWYDPTVPTGNGVSSDPNGWGTWVLGCDGNYTDDQPHESPTDIEAWAMSFQFQRADGMSHGYGTEIWSGENGVELDWSAEEGFFYVQDCIDHEGCAH